MCGERGSAEVIKLALLTLFRISRVQQMMIW